MSTLKTNRIENLTTTDGGISIDNSGRVGIGTSTPSVPLDVETSNDIVIEARSTDRYAHIDLIDNAASSRFTTDGATGTLRLRADTGDAVASSAIQFEVDGSEKARIDGSGNLGIGLTNISGSGSLTLVAGQSYKFAGSGGNTIYGDISADTSHNITFKNNNGTERMRIDSAGRVGIATTTPGNFDAGADNLVVGSGSGDNGITIYSGDSDLANLYFADGTSTAAEKYAGGLNYSHSTNSMAFFTNGGQTQMRLDSSGNITLIAGTPDWVIRPGGISDIYGRVDIGKDSQAVNGTGLYVVSNDNNSYASSVNFRNIGTGPSVICRTQAGADAFRVESNGDVKSATNSYGSTSDVKYKENIVDASSQWDDVKAIRVRNFNFKEDTLYDTSTQIGVIAQEIETVSPGLVTSTVDSDEEGNDLGSVTKSVKYSVLYMKSVKALQEAMERIETLETEVAALKSN